MPAVKDTFDDLPSHFQPDRAAETRAVVQYEIGGEGGGTWHAVIRDGTCTVHEGAAETSNLTVQMDAQDWLDVTAGRKNPGMLFALGKVRFKGDMALAMKLASLFV